ncbi:hypothetical protein ACJJTC_001111 [Scirpophaga incertulas]
MFHSRPDRRDGFIKSRPDRVAGPALTGQPFLELIFSAVVPASERIINHSPRCRRVSARLFSKSERRLTIEVGKQSVDQAALSHINQPDAKETGARTGGQSILQMGGARSEMSTLSKQKSEKEIISSARCTRAGEPPAKAAGKAEENGEY